MDPFWWFAIGTAALTMFMGEEGFWFAVFIDVFAAVVYGLYCLFSGGFVVPLFVWILIGVFVYLVGGAITMGVFNGTEQADKFTSDEKFGLFIVWPLVAIKGLFYSIGRTRSGFSAVWKLFTNW